MKKVFISLPMTGLTNEEIETKMDAIKKFVRALYIGQEVEFLDSLFKDFDGPPLAFIGKSILLLAEADVAVFGYGWKEARGCRIEHQCCKEYGINTLYSIDFRD